MAGFLTNLPPLEHAWQLSRGRWEFGYSSHQMQVGNACPVSLNPPLGSRFMVSAWPEAGSPQPVPRRSGNVGLLSRPVVSPSNPPQAILGRGVTASGILRPMEPAAGAAEIVARPALAESEGWAPRQVEISTAGREMPGLPETIWESCATIAPEPAERWLSLVVAKEPVITPRAAGLPRFALAAETAECFRDVAAAPPAGGGNVDAGPGRRGRGAMDSTRGGGAFRGPLRGRGPVVPGNHPPSGAGGRRVGRGPTGGGSGALDPTGRGGAPGPGRPGRPDAAIRDGGTGRRSAPRPGGRAASGRRSLYAASCGTGGTLAAAGVRRGRRMGDSGLDAGTGDGRDGVRSGAGRYGSFTARGSGGAMDRARHGGNARGGRPHSADAAVCGGSELPRSIPRSGRCPAAARRDLGANSRRRTSGAMAAGGKRDPSALCPGPGAGAGAFDRGSRFDTRDGGRRGGARRGSRRALGGARDRAGLRGRRPRGSHADVRGCRGMSGHTPRPGRRSASDSGSLDAGARRRARGALARGRHGRRSRTRAPAADPGPRSPRGGAVRSVHPAVCTAAGRRTGRRVR